MVQTLQRTGSSVAPAGSRRPVRLAVRLLVAVGWITVGALAIVALLRVVAWDDTEPLVLLNVLTLYLYLPAWLIAILAGIGRRVLLTLAALAVGGAQIAFLLPVLSAERPLPAWTSAPGTAHIRLFDANIDASNPSMSGYIRQIGADRPDLVTLEEAVPESVSQLESSPALAALPYRYQVFRYDPWAFLVASRWPLRSTRVVSMFGRPLVVETVLELPSGPQQLWVVHTVAPVPASFEQWRQQLDELRRLVAAHGSSRLLVVGDFNATWDDAGFAGVLSAGLTDAAAARGDPFQMTWSQSYSPLPPFVRIDHILYGAGLSTTAIRAATGPGSDHRELLATIAVQPRGRAPRA